MKYPIAACRFADIKKGTSELLISLNLYLIYGKKSAASKYLNILINLRGNLSQEEDEAGVNDRVGIPTVRM
jgi:hypothetical protein